MRTFSVSGRTCLTWLIVLSFIISCNQTKRVATADRTKSQPASGFLVGLLGIITLSSCGKSGSSTSAAATISGVATAGPVASGTVSAYEIKSDGSLGTPVATGTTDADGNYTLDLPKLPDSPVILQIEGGTYVEEASGSTVSLTTKLSVSIPNTSVTQGTTVTAAVSPLTDMAFSRLQTQMQQGLPAGTDAATAATNANYAVSQAYGLSDIVGTKPPKPTGIITSDEAGKYALVLAALSKSAQTAGVDSVAMAKGLGEVFKSTGIFNPSAAVTVANAEGKSVTFTPPALTSVQSNITAIQNGASMPGMTGATIPNGSDLAPPILNALPPASAPPDYKPGTGSGSSSSGGSTATKVSCTISGSIVGSCTRTMASNQTLCIDYAKTNLTYEQILNISCTGGTASHNPCLTVNASLPYKGGDRISPNAEIVVFNRYFGSGYDANHIKDTSNCEPGT